MTEMLSGGDMLIRALQDEESNTYSVIPAVLPCIYTMRFFVSKRSSIFWCATNKQPLIWPTVTLVQPATPG